MRTGSWFPLREPKTVSYAYGLFIGLLTCLGFAFEIALDTSRDKEYGWKALVAVLAGPFFLNAVSLVAEGMTSRHDLPKFITIPLLLGFLVVTTAARKTFVQFMVVVCLIVAALTGVELAKKALHTLRPSPATG